MHLDEDDIEVFMSAHRLPSDFMRVVTDHYLPLAEWIAAEQGPRRQLLVGICGAQGTGKSTLAAFLEGALAMTGRRVAALSLDDFYLTRAERAKLAATVHPLLATRGVPGTHDVALLMSVLDALHGLGEEDTIRLPRFDKATDDRASPDAWRAQGGPVDIVLLEGWCVGSVAEDEAALAKPVNALEADEDPDGRWRRWVNERLTKEYAGLRGRLDRLVYLAAPDLDAVYRWRRKQEEKLRSATSRGTRLLGPVQLRRFVMHYERLTRANAKTLPGLADAVLELDQDHRCTGSRYGRSPKAPARA